MNNSVYLDYAATTPVKDQVLESMIPFFIDRFGNSSSVHTYGQDAENALIKARESISDILNCQPNELVFTSCGSESDNLALRGVSFAARHFMDANHILISPVEHHAVSITAEHLRKFHGFNLEYLPVDRYGLVDPVEVKNRIRKDTSIVSIIYANNEIGTINSINEIGEICKGKGVPFHTDAVQAGAYLNLDVKSLNVDLMSIGAHKFYGPKGIGALFIKDGTTILPELTGGGQEFGLRAGTHNIPYIVGMAEALNISVNRSYDQTKKNERIRDQLIQDIITKIPDSHLTGHPIQRLPNHASFIFNDIDGNELLIALDMNGYACSSGSACKTGSPEPSEVLLALGYTRKQALGSIRVTIGTATTINQIESFIQTLARLISLYRNNSSPSL